MALNARRETFAKLVALGTLSLIEAYRQAGYSEKSGSKGALVLTQNAAVAARINSLRSAQRAKQAKQAAKLEISRERLLQELADLAFEHKADLAFEQANNRSSKLKAIELIAKLLGYNEPERVAHQHQHIHVDAGLIEDLRAGYAALGERQRARIEGAPLLLAEGAVPAGVAQQEAYPCVVKGTPQGQAEGPVTNINTPL